MEPTAPKTSLKPSPQPSFSREKFDSVASAIGRLQNADSCDILLYGKPEQQNKNLLPIKAHKLILSAASAHLRDAFLSVGFLDSNTNEYTIEEIEHESLQLVVNFVYTGKLNFSGEIETRLKSVLIAADYLDLPELVAVCEQGLVTSRSFASMSCSVDMWVFAKTYRCVDLAKHALYRMRHFSWLNLAKEDSFLRLPVDDVSLLLKEIESLSIGNACYGDSPADDIGQITAAWISHDKAKRSGVAGKLMQSVPINKMSLESLEKLVKSLTRVVSRQVLAEIRKTLDTRLRCKKKVMSMKAEMQEMDKRHKLKRKELEDKIDENEKLAEPGLKRRRFEPVNSTDGEEDDDDDEHGEYEGYDEHDYSDYMFDPVYRYS